LRSLLPETDTDIKGQMRSIEELRVISVYADRPEDFAELTRILDNDIRLITPSDPEGSANEEAPSNPPKLAQVARDPWRSPKERLHASLALLPQDGSHGDYVVDSFPR
jgi:hypothetical protein